MQLFASVTFEFDTAPMETYRGSFVAVKPQTVAHRAFRAACRAYPGRRWRSAVIVLEKLDPADPPTADPLTNAPQ